MSFQDILKSQGDMVQLDRALMILKRAIIRMAIICFISGLISGIITGYHWFKP